MHPFAIALDVIVLVVLGLNIFISHKKGFARSILELVAWIVAVIMATYLSAPLANFAYDSLEPKFLGDTDNYINSTVDATGNTLQDAVQRIYDSLPDSTSKIVSMFGKDSQEVAEDVKTNSADAPLTVRKIIDISIKPALISFIKFIISLLIFIISLPLLQILAKIVSKLFDLPIIASVNKFLGGALGVLKGLVILLFISALLNLFIVCTENKNNYANTDNVKSSYIFSIIDKYNPLSQNSDIS